MIKADLSALPHVIKSVTNVIGFLGEQSGEPIPLRTAEVNRH